MQQTKDHDDVVATLPRHLERYAAEVDEGRRAALAARTDRASAHKSMVHPKDRALLARIDNVLAEYDSAVADMRDASGGGSELTGHPSRATSEYVAHRESPWSPEDLAIIAANAAEALGETCLAQSMIESRAAACATHLIAYQVGCAA